MFSQKVQHCCDCEN